MDPEMLAFHLEQMKELEGWGYVKKYLHQRIENLKDRALTAKNMEELAHIKGQKESIDLLFKEIDVKIKQGKGK